MEDALCRETSEASFCVSGDLLHCLKQEQRICEENRAHSSPTLLSCKGSLSQERACREMGYMSRGNCVVCRIDKARMQSCVNDQRDWGDLVLQIAKN